MQGAQDVNFLFPQGGRCSLCHSQPPSCVHMTEELNLAFFEPEARVSSSFGKLSVEYLIIQLWSKQMGNKIAVFNKCVKGNKDTNDSV